jgi:hypothetical protein
MLDWDIIRAALLENLKCPGERCDRSDRRGANEYEENELNEVIRFNSFFSFTSYLVMGGRQVSAASATRSRYLPITTPCE